MFLLLLKRGMNCVPISIYYDIKNNKLTSVDFLIAIDSNYMEFIEFLSNNYRYDFFKEYF